MSETFLSELTGSFSTPSGGNPTVAMVEAAYEHHKLNFRYINCEVKPKDLANAILGARAMNWAGFNLSIPHKVTVIQHLDGLGGGDTGADCLGTAIRQGAKTVTQLEILPRPTQERPSDQPWPTYPMIYRVSSAHEEAGERVYSVSTKEFVKDDLGNLVGVKLVETLLVDGKFQEVPNSEKQIPADLVLLALGFTGPEKSDLLTQLEVELDERGNIKRDHNYATSSEGVFVCGDAGRGQSLIVWAIAEGRSAASAVDRYLTGNTQLPYPIEPTARPMMV